jgi:arylsulfatase A-like enzyme
VNDAQQFTRREILRLVAATGAMTALGRFPLARAQGEKVAAPAMLKRSRRPNILMLVGDDHRHDAIRAMGDAVVQTPCLDRLAAGGAAFTQAHHMGGKMSPVCVPTRGSLMTGCSVYRAMIDPADNLIRPNRVTLGEHLRANGYSTHIIGKWHNDFASLNRTFAGGDAIFLRGLASDQYRLRLNHYDPTGAYGKNTVYHADKFSTDFLCDHAVDFLTARRGDEPFFLYTAFTSPHDPRTPPPEFANLYRPGNIPLPANFAAMHPFDNGDLRVRDEDTAPHPRSPDRVRRELAAYYGMISNLDTGIGRILAALEASGQAENTIVVYTGDHGLALGQHGLMGKQNLYDHSTRVPLLLRGPGIPAGQRSDALLYAWDVFPTLCELTGVTPPADLDARSLAPILRGEQADHRREVHALYRDFQRMAKNERWKLIEYAVGPQRHTQLFDLQDDPWETRNLAADPAAAGPLTELRASLRRWQTASSDTGFGTAASFS